MANFATEVAQIGSKWPIFFSNFNVSQVSPQKAAHIDLKWPISPNSQLFQSFPIQISSFLAKSQIGGGGTLAKFSQICNFLNCFQPQWLKMTHDGQFCHQSGSNWLKIANFGQFSTFPRFSPKKRLRLTWNG